MSNVFYNNTNGDGIVGPQGPPGIQGPKGDKGDKGDQGDPGTSDTSNLVKLTGETSQTISGNIGITGLLEVGEQIHIPKKTTAQRDSLTAIEGSSVYNTDYQTLQVYNNSNKWVDVAPSSNIYGNMVKSTTPASNIYTFSSYNVYQGFNTFITTSANMSFSPIAPASMIIDRTGVYTHYFSITFSTSNAGVFTYNLAPFINGVKAGGDYTVSGVAQNTQTTINYPCYSYMSVNNTISFRLALVSGGSLDNITTVHNLEHQCRLIYQFEGQEIATSKTLPTVYINGNLNFTGNKSHWMGEIYATDNTTGQAMTAGVWVKLSIPTIISQGMDFDMPTNNRLRYTGSIMRMCHVAFSLSYKAGLNDITKFKVYQNGSPINTSQAVMTSTSANGSQSSTAIHVVATLNQNDYIEVWASNSTSRADTVFLITDFNLFAMSAN